MLIVQLVVPYSHFVIPAPTRSHTNHPQATLPIVNAVAILGALSNATTGLRFMVVPHVFYHDEDGGGMSGAPSSSVSAVPPPQGMCMCQHGEVVTPS
jgi:hypothetical protein